MPFTLAVSPRVTKIGDDQVWTAQQPIVGSTTGGLDNLIEIVRDPEKWVRSFPEPAEDEVVATTKGEASQDDATTDAEPTFPEIAVPSKFTLNIHHAVEGVPADHVLVQGINGTDAINLYFPVVISKALRLTAPTLKPPLADLTGLLREVALLFDSADITKPNGALSPGKGQMFLHYPIFKAKGPITDAHSKWRAFVIAELCLNIVRSTDATVVGQAAGQLSHSSLERNVQYRVGNTLKRFNNPAEARRIEFKTYDVSASPRHVILTEKDSYREACEILVAMYNNGDITFEEAYCKAYAGP